MISLLNLHLLTDLSKIVLEYVTFTQKQLDLVMNSKPFSLLLGTRSYLNDKQRKQLTLIPVAVCLSIADCGELIEDPRFSLVFTMNNSPSMMDILLVKTDDFSKYIKVTLAKRRGDDYQKHSIHFHGNSIVIALEAEKNSKYQIYDFESFGEVF
jgi:hypothetical protein